MISVIKMDYTFKQLLKDKKELKIGNLIFCYENVEGISPCIRVFIRNKNNEVMFSTISMENDDRDFTLTYVLFNQNYDKSAIFLSENSWQLLYPHISYGLVDIELSIKYGNIFYLSD